MLEAMTPIVRFLPPARLRAWRLGWYFSSSMAFTTRRSSDLLTTLASFRTRETVAVETLARRATCSRFMSSYTIVRVLNPYVYPLKLQRKDNLGLDSACDSAYTSSKPADGGYPVWSCMSGLFQRE